MKKITLLFGLLIIATTLFSQNYNYKFRLKLKDKGNSGYTIDRPEEFLSPKAIERRLKQNIAIDSTDIPIAHEYIKIIENSGVEIVTKSKWLGTISIQSPDSLMVDSLKKLPFISDALFVWKGIQRAARINNDNIVKYPTIGPDTLPSYYGEGERSIKLNNGQFLHGAGYKGKGMDIAVIDAGFNRLPKIEVLDNLDIKGYKNFVYGQDNMFSNVNQHGLSVLSCIGANRPNMFVGTAPEASFWLFSTEDSRSEFPIEEDYWAAAIEYADSVGVDVVNSSLGYSNFDYPAKSYTHEDLDGKTAYITQAANAAAKKGMLLVISAGNSGTSPWRKITPPSDAANVLTVGAVRRDSIIANFSSRGMTADLRVKPGVMALGVSATVVNDKGRISRSSGTSFSSPIMTGMVACLWQAFPALTNKEILEVVRASSEKYEAYNEDYGYGIPDMEKAMQLAKEMVDKKPLKNVKK